MKKFLALSVAVAALLLLTACGSPSLKVLNWGEYINEDVVAAFEEATGIKVDIDEMGSNEEFYQAITAETTTYDIVIPSDYMIEKLVAEDLVQAIDYDLLDNYVSDEATFTDAVHQIQATMDPDTEGYYVPYFWGSFGLMYNVRTAGLETALEASTEGGWDVYFNPDLRPLNTRVGMYDVAQYAYATALVYLGYEDFNLPPTTALLGETEDALIGAGFVSYGDDGLKRDIKDDNLDLAYVWTGDFLDMLYSDLASNPDSDGSFSYDEIIARYNIFIPSPTMAFMDAMVIPSNAVNVGWAHEFIDWFLDPINAMDNASIVGYATPVQAAYDDITSYVGSDPWLTDWARAYDDYYSELNGSPYANLSEDDLQLLSDMFDVVKQS